MQSECRQLIGWSSSECLHNPRTHTAAVVELADNSGFCLFNCLVQVHYLVCVFVERREGGREGVDVNCCICPLAAVYRGHTRVGKNFIKHVLDVQ